MSAMNDETVLEVVRELLQLRRTVLSAMLPPEAERHFRAARKEALLGMQAILQVAIDKCDEEPTAKKTAAKRASRKIEVTE
ncbi:MAG TPA: hypothetical protein VF260_09125 [Bacilli bacterium]